MNSLITNVVSAATGRSPHQLQIRQRPPLPIQSNNLYDIFIDDHHYIAKEYLQPKEVEAAPEREFKTLQLLSAYDLAPQPLFYDARIGPVVLYEFLLGAMWNRQQPDAARLEALAEVWLQLHDLDTNCLWPSRGLERAQLLLPQIEDQLTQYQQWLGDRKGLSGRLCEQIVTAARMAKCRLDKYPTQLRFSKCDTRFANIISRPDGRVGMVDWEDAGLLDPARAVADLMVHANQEDMLLNEDWTPFRKAFYAGTHAVDPTMPERVALYEVLLSCAWLGLFCIIGVQKSDYEDLSQWRANGGVLVNDKIRRYVARILAGPAGTPQAYLPNLEQLTCFPPTIL